MSHDTASPQSHSRPAAPQAAAAMWQCISDLFPLHRSMTGEGVRQTMRYLQQHLPLEIHEVPTGTPVFDWQVPREWKINDAWIADASGKRVVDYRDSNLQVISGSQPIDGEFTFAELQPNLVTLGEELDATWIPYRTAFFREAWGFCVSRNQWNALASKPRETYRVVIDAEHFEGSLTYGEATFRGRSEETILVYAHCCHPSLANDNLSGIAVATRLGQHLQNRIGRGDRPGKTYKIVFAPATIGAITWLAQNEESLCQIRGGLVLSLLGDRGSLTYKQSRETRSSINHCVRQVADNHGITCTTRAFDPFGYDERQFGSPGVNLPVGCLMRSANGKFPEYHTSGDDLSLIDGKSLAESLFLVTEVLRNLEDRQTPVSLAPKGEPQLGLRGLYRAFGQHDDRGRFQEAVMWLLNLADGKHDLHVIAELGDLPLDLVRNAAHVLAQHQLIKIDLPENEIE